MEKPQPRKPLDQGHDDKGQSNCYECTVLRFFGVWNDQENLYGDKRYFALRYFLEDGTIELIEQHPNNSGRMPCNFFLNRARVPKALQPMALIGQSQVGDMPQDCWTVKDLHVGAEIDIYGRKVFLYDCDEQTRRFYKTKYGIDNCPINVSEPCKTTSQSDFPPKSPKIEEDSDAYTENQDQFLSESNIKVIMQKINSQLADRKKAAVKMFEEKDSQCTNTVHPEDFRSILRKLMPDQNSMTDHEMITVMWYYGDRNGPNMSLERLVTLARSLLQKVGYEMQDQTMQALVNTDKKHSGLLTPKEIYSTLRGCHLPLEPELLHNIITRMPTKEHRYINYKDLVHALAWEDQVGALHHPDRFRYDCRLVSELVPGITEVRYKEFLHAAGVLSGPSP